MGNGVVFSTDLGEAIAGDSRTVLETLPADSTDLVVTSPPFALLREKAYGNPEQHEYEDWLCSFGPPVKRILKDTGSLVLDLGGAYQRGRPVRSLHNFKVLIRLCEEHGFHLAEEFFWHNPSRLPSPIEWVNKRKIRAKDSVNTVWWLSKTPWPKADVSRVLVPYSARMKELLRNPLKFYRPKERPSGHDISAGFGTDNGGAIPSNLLQYSNSESNSDYLRLCKQHGIKPHPARFPVALPEFFIKFLTAEGDLVVDIFGGSGTTAQAAESLGRRWKTMEIDIEYARTSVLRFAGTQSHAAVKQLLDQLARGESPHLASDQPSLFSEPGREPLSA
jgi:DNA modification methylase